MEHLNDLTKWVNEQVGKDVQTTYEQYRKIKEFEDVGYFLLPYVVSGGVVTQDILRNDEILVTDIVVSLSDDVMYRRGTDFRVRDENSIYYLDFTKEGDWHFETSHPEGLVNVDYLTIAELNTDSNGVINSIVDKRGVVGGFRLKDEYGLEGYVKEPEFNIVRKRVDNEIVGTTRIIAEDNAYNSWPSLIKTSTGRLICMYNSGASHESAGGTAKVPGRKIVQRYSDDMGVTWSDEVLILGPTVYSCMAHGIISLSTGRIMINVEEFFEDTPAKSYMMFSDDNGITWVEGFRFENSTDPDIAATGTTNMIIEIGGGTLLTFKNVIKSSNEYGMSAIFSYDNGNTWNTSVVISPATNTGYNGFPWEIRPVYLGNNKIMAIGRSRNNMYQITSIDNGVSFNLATTNIEDARNICASLLYFPEDDCLAMYYADRLSNTIKKRISNATILFDNPTAWSDPEVYSYSSSITTAFDFGYTTVIRSLDNKREVMIATYGTRETYEPVGIPKNCGIVLMYDSVPARSPNNFLFRDVNTASPKNFSIYRGDGTNAVVFRVQNGVINTLNGIGITISGGNGSPEGTVTANNGSLYLRRNGAANTTLYIKETGTGNTGWVAK